MDLNWVRDQFPICQDHVYLNNAAHSPMSKNGRAALDQYLDFLQFDIESRPEIRSEIKQQLSGLLGGQSHDYAITTSTAHGMNLVANGLDLRADDNVVLAEGEHWSSCYPWFNQRGKNVEVRMAAPDAENRISVEAMATLCDDKTKVICVTAVRFDTGFRYDLRGLSKLAKAHDALLVVDGIQCAGAMPMNVLDEGIDVLVCAGFKWLLGGTGTGFLYANDRARDRIKPVAPGMFAAHRGFFDLEFFDDARKYETGTVSNLMFFGWHAGLKLLADVGITNIEKRNFELTDYLLSGLQQSPLTVLTPCATRAERSAIVTVTSDDDAYLQGLQKRFLARKVCTSTRGKHIRISPNFFNVEADLDQLIECL